VCIFPGLLFSSLYASFRWFLLGCACVPYWAWSFIVTFQIHFLTIYIVVIGYIYCLDFLMLLLTIQKVFYTKIFIF